MVEFMAKGRVYLVTPNQYYYIIELDHWSDTIKPYEYLIRTAVPVDYLYL